MVEVTYHCPYCGALTSLERDAYMADRCVTPEPLEGWEYAATTGDYEEADGVEFVCLGDATPAADDRYRNPEDTDFGTIDTGNADPNTGGEDVDPGSGPRDGDPDPAGSDDREPTDEVSDGCGRTFYLSYVRYEDGEEVDPHGALNEGDDPPRFDFLG